LQTRGKKSGKNLEKAPKNCTNPDREIRERKTVRSLKVSEGRVRGSKGGEKGKNSTTGKEINIG